MVLTFDNDIFIFGAWGPDDGLGVETPASHVGRVRGPAQGVHLGIVEAPLSGHQTLNKTITISSMKK